MQEMQYPDGSMLKELFTGDQVKNGGMQRRREMLERQGFKFIQAKPYEDRSRYNPHQGSKELARRLRQMAKQAEPV